MILVATFQNYKVLDIGRPEPWGSHEGPKNTRLSWKFAM